MKTTPLAQTAPTFFSPPPHAHACVLPPARRRAAFTLVELLVVIGVIAVLIGILLPVLGKARKAGTAAVCMSNMRQLATATTSYTLDHSQKLPQPANEGGISVAGSTSSPAAQRVQASAMWFNALDYYVGNPPENGTDAALRNYNSYKQDPIWLDLPESVIIASGAANAQPEHVRTIKMNAYLGYTDAVTTPPSATGNAVKFFKITDIPLPSKTALYTDGRGHDTVNTDNGRSDYTATGGGGVSLFSAREIYVAPRHEGGANITKLDGSSEHQVNPVKNENGGGYPGWYDNDDTNPDLRPDLIFDFDQRSTL